MLINLTNHPYAVWDEKQKGAAAAYGECVDIPFPAIPAMADEQEILRLARDYADRIVPLKKVGEATVHVMGEQTFCFALIRILQDEGIRCIASCSERDVTMAADGSKQVRFHFARFREYQAG